jgi:hypothetical protein
LFCFETSYGFQIRYLETNFFGGTPYAHDSLLCPTSLYNLFSITKQRQKCFFREGSECHLCFYIFLLSILLFACFISIIKMRTMTGCFHNYLLHTYKPYRSPVRSRYPITGGMQITLTLNVVVSCSLISNKDGNRNFYFLTSHFLWIFRAFSYIRLYFRVRRIFIF